MTRQYNPFMNPLTGLPECLYAGCGREIPSDHYLCKNHYFRLGEGLVEPCPGQGQTLQVHLVRLLRRLLQAPGAGERPRLAGLYAESNKSNGCPRSGAAPPVAGVGRFFTVRSWPRHSGTPGRAVSATRKLPRSCCLKCVKSSLGGGLELVQFQTMLDLDGNSRSLAYSKNPSIRTVSDML